MAANLNKTGLILMTFALRVARFHSRKIIELLIGKCVEKEVRQGIISRGQPTRGGPPAWGLGEVLTTPPC